MFSLLFGSYLKIGAAVGIVLALTFGFFQVRGCMKAKEELKFIKATIKNQRIIDEHDKVIDKDRQQKINNLKKELEGLPPNEQAQKIKDVLDQYFQEKDGD